MNKLALSVTLILIGCGGSGNDNNTGRVTFETVTTPLRAGADFSAPNLQLEAFDDLILYGNDGRFLSRDGGVTWLENDITTDGPIVGARVFPNETLVRMTQRGILEYKLSENTWTFLSGAPPGTIRLTAWTRSEDGTAYWVADSTADSLYRFRNGTWTTLDLGSTAPSGLTEAYAIRVSGQSLYVATQHGLYVSTNDGATWDWRQQNIYCEDLELLPSGRLLISTALQGVVASDDGGVTTTPLTLPENRFVRREGTTLYQNYHQSDDGGDNWTVVFDPEKHGGAGTDVVRYADGKAFAHLGNKGFFVSQSPYDALLFRGGVESLHVAPSTNTLTAFQSVPILSENGYLMKTETAGPRVQLALYDQARADWVWRPWNNMGETLIATGLPQKLSDQRLALLRGEAIWFSNDEGKTWSSPTPVWSPPPVSDSFSPSTVYGLWEGADGTLYASSQWKYCPMQSGVECTTVETLATSRDGGSSWERTIEDGPQVVAVSGDVVYAPGMLSDDRGVTWKASNVPFPLAGTMDGLLVYTDTTIAPHPLYLSRDGGSGTLLGEITIEDALLAHSSSLLLPNALQIDDSNHLYFVCGTPLQQICRAISPL